MKKMKRSDYVLYGAIVILGIVLDQITKLLAVKFLKPIDTQPLIKNVLHLTYVENRGAAFGMLSDSRWVFITVSIIAIGALSFYIFGGLVDKKIYGIASSIILAGGVGNMIDRLLLGYVVDFIDFRLINFAVFNGADSFICVGAGILILALSVELVKEVKKAKREKRK